MLRLIQSNDLNQLANRYAEIQAAHPRDLLQPEIVIIQSAGTGQWLKLRTAENLGVSANISCQLPAQFIWQLYQSELGLTHQRPIEASALQFRLMQILPDFDHPTISTYLSKGEDTDLRCYQLAHQISGVFERYLLYRPDWILAFEADKNPLHTVRHGEWQQRLWQRLIQEDPTLKIRHRAYLHRRLMMQLDNVGLSEQYPARLSLFGLPSLAPMHLETFTKLAEHRQVDLFFMNPSETYWGDLTTERLSLRQALTTSADGTAELDSLFFIGNPLLASLGRQGQEFHEMLTAETHLVSEEIFRPGNRLHRLGVLQDDIACAYAEDESPPVDLKDAADDPSIEVHSCHSRLREMEVLLDRVYRAMTESELSPADIVVMAPNIQDYVPVIHAVFADELAFGIADQNQHLNSDVIRAFLKLLALPKSRLPASELGQYLEVEAVARKFSLDQDAIDKIQHWIKATGIRWEQDAAAKNDRWDLPPEAPFTWQFGIDRLLMGLMVDSPDLVSDILPEAIGIDDLPVLESFLTYSEAIFQTRADFDVAKTPQAWAEILGTIVNRCFEGNGYEQLDINLIFNLIEEFKTAAEEASFNRPVAFEFVQSWFTDQLSRPNPAMRFISGGITFSTLTPMRSIPFKMVCLIGLNEGEFPRRDPKHPFDLMADQGHRLGDRSQRDDDRYLFLEALLSARDRLHISYCGRGIRDNEIRPPSVLLSELMDYCQAVMGDITFIDHPLQPFSERYFIDPKLHSFQNHWRPQQAVQETLTQPPAQLRAKHIPPTVCSTRELAQFLSHTARYFYETALGVTFDSASALSDDVEPFTIDPLTRFQILEDAIQANAQGVIQDQWLARIIRTGQVPTSAAGYRKLETVFEDAKRLYFAIAPYYKTAATPRRYAIEIAGFELHTTLTQFDDRHNLMFRAGDLTPRHLLTSWLDHLLLATEGRHVETMTFGLHQGALKTGSFPPLDPKDAHSLLDCYLNRYRAGASQLLLFPFDTSTEILKLHEKALPITEIGLRIDQKWRDSDRWREATDPYWMNVINAPSEVAEALLDEALLMIKPIFDHWQVP